MSEKRERGKSRVLGVVLVIGLCVVLGLMYAAGFAAEMLKMDPLETAEALPGVYGVNNGFVNFYIVKDGDTAVAFDAGVDAEASAAALEELNIDADAVAAVFLTHTDYDHIAALSCFPNATVYISKAEEQMIDGTTNRAFMSKNSLPCAYETVEDGETVTAGSVSATCIVTPGHTKGSACYSVNGKYLFVGDTISLQDGKAGLFDPYFNMDGKEQEKSIQALAGMSGLAGVQAVFTGHYGWSGDFAAVFEGKLN